MIDAGAKNRSARSAMEKATPTTIPSLKKTRSEENSSITLPMTMVGWVSGRPTEKQVACNTSVYLATERKLLAEPGKEMAGIAQLKAWAEKAAVE